MAKYLVDLDSFIECLDFLSLGKLNGSDYTYVDNVKALVQRFPKNKVEEEVIIKITTNLEDCN